MGRSPGEVPRGFSLPRKPSPIGCHLGTPVETGAVTPGEQDKGHWTLYGSQAASPVLQGAIQTTTPSQETSFLTSKIKAYLEEVIKQNDPPVFLFHNQFLPVQSKTAKSEGSVNAESVNNYLNPHSVENE